MTPRFSFARLEGRVLQSLLWLISLVFFVIMGATWRAAEKAKPVMLKLENSPPAVQSSAP